MADVLNVGWRGQERGMVNGGGVVSQRQTNGWLGVVSVPLQVLIQVRPGSIYEIRDSPVVS